MHRNLPIIISAPDLSEESGNRIHALFAAHAPANQYELRLFSTPPQSIDDWVDRTANVDGVLLGWKMPQEVLLASPSFKAVSFLGTGISDHIDLQLCNELGITTMIATSYGDNAVAEHTIALMLSAWNRIPDADSCLRRGEWAHEKRHEFKGRILGIIGYGGIGRRVAELGDALELEVKVWSRSLLPDTPLTYGNPATLTELLETADIVSLHLALNSGTSGFIGKREFQLMKSSSLLVNTARAAIVDQDALIDALVANTIGGAAIDVFDDEPLRRDDPILTAPNTVLTPHIAYKTVEASETLFYQSAQNLIKYFWG